MIPGLREYNLEAGKPFVDEAMKRLKFEIDRSRKLNCTVLKVIHGYGSSGKGGKIRTASRKLLEEMKRSGQIADYLPGESFSIFEAATRKAFLKCDELRKDRDLDRSNNGVTFVILK